MNLPRISLIDGNKKMEPFKFNNKLSGNRVYLEKHKLEDAVYMFECVEKERERLSKFLPWPQDIQSVEDEEKFIKDSIELWEKKLGFGYSIFLKKSGTYMGNIGVFNLSWKYNCCEIGYWLSERYEGYGYMSEATEILENYLFKEGFNRIEIRCDVKNTRSSAIPERLLYKLEGILRENLKYYDSYIDTKVYSKLRSEWVKNNLV